MGVVDELEPTQRFVGLLCNGANPGRELVVGTRPARRAIVERDFIRA
jgi:hypothetical protein